MDSKIQVTRSSMPDYDEYCTEIRELWDSHWLTNMGVKHNQFQKQLEEYLGCPHVALFANGHLALETIISAFDFPIGSEIITTPFTFASTTHAIAKNGLTPVFCDINADDYTINVDLIESLISDKTVAIVPVHVYGNMCDVESLERIASRYDLKLIYDAAHAFGVRYKGVSSASFGDAAMFSFHATKVFNTIEGGAVCYNNDNLTPILRALTNFGIVDEVNIDYVSGNAKMNEFQAAMGICNLRHIEKEIEKRERVFNHYYERLNNISGIYLNTPKKNVDSNYAYFPVLFDGYSKTRDSVINMLSNNNIFARRYFYPITNSFNCYQDFEGSSMIKTPIAKYVSEKVLTLPMYSDLSTDDVDRICDIITKY